MARQTQKNPPKTTQKNKKKHPMNAEGMPFQSIPNVPMPAEMMPEKDCQIIIFCGAGMVQICSAPKRTGAKGK